MSALRPRVLDPDVECKPLSALWDGVVTELQQAVARLARHPHHGPRFAGIDPRSILQPADLAALPTTTKAHLHPEGNPLAHLCVPRAQLARVHASSGTTSERTLVAYTTADVVLWTHLVARGLAAVGVCEDTVCYSVLKNGLFTGGFGFHQAAESLSACTVPAGPGGSAAHVALMQRLRPDVLFATPSYALHLARAHGPVPPVPLGVFGAEPWTEADRHALSRLYTMRALDTYGLSEVIGPGVAFECGYSPGWMHVNADVVWPEVVDPNTLAPLPLGHEGELVLTIPRKQALPLVRYRTGDRTTLTTEPCPCGRTLPRMARVRSRVDEMKVVRGVNVRPSQVAAVVDGRAFALALDGGELQVHIERRLNEDTVPHSVFERVAQVVGLRIEPVVHAPGALPHGGGKVCRWL